MRHLWWLFLISLLAGLTGSATTIQIPSRDALSSNDYIDWGQLPSSITILNTPVNITSDQGSSASIVSSSPVFSDQQGNPWAGNFAPGDSLLGTGQFSSAAPISIIFASPVRGFATQIGYNVMSEVPFPFTATVSLFDSTDTLLASFDVPGFMQNHADNSAVVIGALDSTFDIARIQFSATAACAQGALDGSFAINRLDLLTDPVPEPASVSLVFLGLAAACWRAGRSSNR